MKKIFITLASVISIASSAFSQKVGIGTNSPSNMLEVVSAVSAPAVASTLGTNNGTAGAAIWGSSNAADTKGIIGSSAKGFGVQGYTNNNIGVSGFSLNGTTFYASSNNSYALQVSGNLKFAGGNTNPSQGAVLTSDATGNATWKKSNVAFLGVATTASPFMQGLFKKVEFVNESYDLQNNFEGYNNGTTPATSSMFTAPVAGVYHFSSSLNFSKSPALNNNYYFGYAQIRLVKNTSAMK